MIIEQLDEMALAQRPTQAYGAHRATSTSQVLPSGQQSQTLLAHEAPEELKSTYHDSFGGTGGFTAPSWKRMANQKQPQAISSVPPTPRPPSARAPADMSRLYDLEGRLSHQERASQNLLDRAMRIKEDVVENLNLTHSTWQGEKKQRELLQEHIRAITELVKRLDRDIKVLENELRVKDSYIASSGNAIKSLELQQATALTDIRGRIARGDAAIAKLANENSAFQESLKQTGNKHQDSINRLNEKIQALEIKIAEGSQKLERSTTETILRTQSKESDLAKNTAVVEAKLKGSIEELKLLLANQKNISDTEREKAVGRLKLDIEKQDAISRERLDKMEARINKVLTDMNSQLKELRSLSSVKDLQKSQQEMEKRLSTMVESSVREQMEKFTRLRNECRQGFASVHDSITNSKSVLEGKLTLSEEQLRKEIGHVKNMVVLV
ncbi:protein FAM81A-like [Watersipora subatra]|uniref:protein FAM81A-like n=1 Tax=Watersipora subatra TaxID=2589382 RepID=UPI00355B99B3